MNIDNLKNFHIYILALLFLAVSHITIRNFGSPLSLPVAYMIWTTISVTVLISVVNTFKRNILVIPNVLKFILLFLILLIAPVFFNPLINSHALTFETAGLIGGIFFFIALHQFDLNEEDRERILYLILASAVIESMISLFQYFNPGTDIFLIVTTANDQIFGNFQHQNLLASYLATSLTISLYLLTGRIFQNFSRLFKAYFYLLVLLISFILFLTGSRAGLIEISIGTLILITARFSYFRKQAAYPVIWILVLVIGVTGSLTFEKLYHKRDSALSSVGRKIDRTVESIAGEKVYDTRIPMYLTAIKMIREKPLTGHGPGNFSSRFMYYRSKLTQEHPEYPYEAAFTTHPHNEFLFRTVESGLPGGAGLLLVMAAFISLLYKLGRERGGTYAAFLFPIAFHMQVGYPLYQSMPHWTLFILLLYLPSSYFVQHVTIKKNTILKSSAITAALGSCIIMLYFTVTTISAQVNLKRYQDILIRGSIKPELIEPSLNNIYLKQLGRRFYYDANFRLGVARSDRKLIEEFADFLLVEKEVFPHPDVFVRGSLALYLVGRRDEAYELINEGLSIYPGMSALVKGKQNLLSADARQGVKH